MQYHTRKVFPNDNQNAKTETIEWDKNCTGLGVRARGARRSWIVQWRDAGKTRKKTLGRFEEITRSEARQLAVALLGASDEPDAAPLNSPTIRAFGERYLAEGAAGWKPATLRANGHCFKTLICAGLADVRLNALTRSEVVTWKTRLPCSAGSANRALAVLSGMMRHAELVGLRAPGSNPCAGLRRRKSSFKAQYLDATGWKQLGAALRAEQQAYPRHVGCIRFMALTGCRRGEALGLRWEMLDGARMALPDSKTGPRAIWLGAAALSLVASFPRTNTFIFGLGNAPLAPASLARSWERIRKAAGRTSLRMHDLRHSFASVAVAEGIDLKVVGKLLGHADLGTTEGYAHLEPPTIKAASQRVGAHLTQAAGAQQSTHKRISRKKRQKRSDPGDGSIYHRFAMSSLSLKAFAQAQGLEPDAFRRALITWRAARTRAGVQS